MTPPLSSAAALGPAAAPHPHLVAQTSQEQIDVASHREMERLLNGGKHPDHSSDFTLYVVLPMLACLGLIMLLRRMLP